MSSTAERAALFPVPATHQRVHNLATGSLERFDGVDWVIDFSRTAAVYSALDPRYGAKGDGKTVTDGAITTGTAVLTSATASFTQQDVGKKIMVQGAGAAGIPLSTTILNRINATTVTLAANSSATVAGKIVIYGTDDTAALAAIIAAITAAGRGSLAFPDAEFVIADDLSPTSNTNILLPAGGKITQMTAGKGVFNVVQKDSVRIWCYGLLYGPGAWSAGWVGVAGHEERAIKFYGCTKSGAYFPRIKNFGLAGWVILGGTDVEIVCPNVEGTHVLGAPLTAGVSSYQFGGLVMHDVTYGAFNDIRVPFQVAYNVAFGVNSVQNVVSTGRLSMPSPHFYSIIGQHGAYLGTSNTSMPDAVIDGCGLDGVKIYSGAANEQLQNVLIPNFNISNCPNGQAIEFGVSGTGFIAASHVSGVATGCSRALTVDGDVRGCTAKIVSKTMGQRALYVAGATGPTDCEWDIVSDSTVEKGALIASATSARNTLRWKGKNSSTGGGGHWMVGVNACASLTIERLECQDLLGNMLYGLYVEVNGLNVRIACTPVIKGYTSAGIKSDALSTEWHGSGGDFTSLATAFASQANNIVPVTPLRLGRQTTVNANVPIWQLTMDDESVYLVTIKLVGKLAGSAERRVVVASAAFFRDAAGVATQQGATDVDVDIASAGFAGTYAFSPTVNDVRVVINSTAAVTYDWRAEITVLKMSP